jgi:hypothetical protein
MATISFHTNTWTGEGFDPHSRPHFWFEPMQFEDVVTVTPIATHFVGPQSFIQVQDVKTEVSDPPGSKVLRYTIVNVGTTTITGYTLHISHVSP